MDDGQDAGRHPVEPPQAADEVGPFLAVEDGVEHVDGVEVAPCAVEIAVDAAGDKGGVAAEVGEVRAQRAAQQDGCDRFDGGVVHADAAVLGAAVVAGGQGGGAEPDELQFPVESDHAEEAPGDGVVEGLGQLQVASLGEELDVASLGVDPGVSGAGVGKLGAAGFDGVEHRVGVQVQALEGVLTVSVPVAGEETSLGPGGDRDEIGVEALESLIEDPGQFFRCARRAGPDHRGRVSSRPRQRRRCEPARARVSPRRTRAAGASR